MGPILLTESDVEALLRMEDVIAALESAFAAHGQEIPIGR